MNARDLMMTRNQKRLSLAWLVALSSGCVESSSPPPPPPFSVEYSTEKLLIGTDFDAPLCLGNIALMDAQLRWLEQEVDGARDEPTWVYLFAGEEAIDACAGAGPVRGCWDETAVYGTWDAMSHELVHAYMSDVSEHVLTVLQEGFAVATSGLALVATRNSRENFTADYLLAPHSGHSGAYESAGHFARWLFAEYGPEIAVELYSRADRGMSEADLSRVFLDVLGAPLDQILSGYLELAADVYPGLGPFVCGQGESVAWDGDGVAWEGEMSCQDGFTIGRYLDDGQVELWRRWRVDIPADGAYEVHFSGWGGTIQRCLTAPAAFDALSPSTEPVSDDWWEVVPLYRPPGLNIPTPLNDGPVMLRAGVHDVWVSQPGDDTNFAFSVSIRRM